MVGQSLKQPAASSVLIPEQKQAATAQKWQKKITINVNGSANKNGSLSSATLSTPISFFDSEM